MHKQQGWPQAWEYCQVGCPSWLKQWEERSALRLRLLTAIWILSWRSSRLCKGKLTETRTDKKSSRGIGMRLLALSLNNHNLIFSGSPLPALALAKAAVGNQPWEEHRRETLSAFLPHSSDSCWIHIHTHTHILITNYYTYTHTYAFTSPIPIPRLRRFEPPAWQAGLCLALLG